MKFRSQMLALVLAFVSGQALLLGAGSALADVGNPADASLSGSYLVGRTAGKLRDPEVAAEYLTRALELDPDNPVLIERLFQLQVSAGQLEEAGKIAEKVLTYNSQHRMARIVLGLQDFRERRYTEARANFAEAAYTPVGELTAALLSAWSYAGEGDLNAAMKELDKLDGNDSFANFKSFHGALIADYLSNAIRADASFKKAYEQSGTSLRVAQAYGNFLERNDKAVEARAVYTGYLDSGDQNILIEAALANNLAGKKPEAFIATPGAGVGEALFSLAAAMTDDQSADVALLYAQLALSFNSDRPVVLTLLGDIYVTGNRYQAAIDAYDQIPADSPLRNNADTEIAINLQRLDRTKEAQERLNKVIERDPKNYAAIVTLGNIYRSVEQYADSSATYDKAIALLPTPTRENWRVFYYRGIANERQKKWPEAEKDFRKALTLEPDEPTILNYLGYSMIEKKINLPEAINMVKKAVEAKPNDGYIVDSLGWAHYQLGNYEEAVVQLERAVELTPADAIIGEHLGDAYWQVGRTLEARFQWQHAKDNKPDPADLQRIEDKLKNGMPAGKPAAAAPAVTPDDSKPAETAPAQPTNG